MGSSFKTVGLQLFLDGIRLYDMALGGLVLTMSTSHVLCAICYPSAGTQPQKSAEVLRHYGTGRQTEESIKLKVELDSVGLSVGWALHLLRYFMKRYCCLVTLAKR